MSKIFPKRKPIIPTGKVVLGGAALVLLLVFFPSSSGDTPEKYMRDSNDLMNELADVHESIDSKETAIAALPQLKALKARLKEIEDRAEKLKIKELPEEKADALNEQFRNEMRKAQERKEVAMQKSA